MAGRDSFVHWYIGTPGWYIDPGKGWYSCDIGTPGSIMFNNLVGTAKPEATDLTNLW